MIDLAEHITLRIAADGFAFIRAYDLRTVIAGGSFSSGSEIVSPWLDPDQESATTGEILSFEESVSSLCNIRNLHMRRSYQPDGWRFTPDSPGCMGDFPSLTR